MLGYIIFHGQNDGRFNMFSHFIFHLGRLTKEGEERLDSGIRPDAVASSRLKTDITEIDTFLDASSRLYKTHFSRANTFH